MNYCLLLLASLATATITTPFPDLEPNATLPFPSLDASYLCASPEAGKSGGRSPSALDCLNVLTYILATTPNHNRPTTWSRTSGFGDIILPYRRTSETCQLVVRLSKSAPIQTRETATFDQVIGAAMRIIEVCILNGRPDVNVPGGVAFVGLGRYLDVVIWGTPGPLGGGGAGLSNETVPLDGSSAWIDQVSQS